VEEPEGLIALQKERISFHSSLLVKRPVNLLV
jgi:hypothetical protein